MGREERTVRQYRLRCDQCGRVTPWCQNENIVLYAMPVAGWKERLVEHPGWHEKRLLCRDCAKEAEAES